MYQQPLLLCSLGRLCLHSLIDLCRCILHSRGQLLGDALGHLTQFTQRAVGLHPVTVTAQVLASLFRHRKIKDSLNRRRMDAKWRTGMLVACSTFR